MHFNRQRVFRCLLMGTVFLASATVGLFIGSRFSSSSRAKKPAEIELADPSRPFLQTKAELCTNYGQPAAGRAQILKQAQGLLFRSGKATVNAELRGDECHYIRYALPQPWSGEQIKKALLQNGYSWIIPSPGGCGWTPLADSNPPQPSQTVEYNSKEGHYAKYTGATRWLEVWSSRPATRAEAPAQIQKPAGVRALVSPLPLPPPNSLRRR
jgi:hypothetical protein